MLINYYRIALRNLRRHSQYTILNVLGLSLGISCSLILYQFISYHLGFDAYHHNRANLYRVVTDLHLEDGSVQHEKGAPLALLTAIQSAIPQVKEEAFLFQNYRDHSFTITADKKLFSEHGNIAFADKHWFNLFDYSWEAGTLQEEPNTAVLTSQQARKYFGKADPIGKTILVDNKMQVTITGILKDPPVNTDTKADVFISLSSMKGFYPDMHHSFQTEWGWINSSNSLFLLLPDNVSPEAVHNAIALLKQKNMPDVGKYYDFHLQPLKEIHFDTAYGGVIPRSLLTTLGIIGFIILMIACVNFINLATAQNARRATEISTRKILGSSTGGIFWQFMTETACITLFAAILAIGWVFLTLPVLNAWLQTNISLHLFQDQQLLAVLLLLILFITFAAGIYPALLLSRFKPVELLKSGSGSTKTPWLRKSLILFQNLVAQSLIICTMIIMLQNNFLKTANLGFNKEGVVMVPVPAPGKKYLQSQLLNLSGVKDVSLCFRPPASATFKAGSVKFDNREWEDYSALCTLGDTHYLKTFGLQLTAGRNLSESDTVREFLVSEDMVKKLGFTNPSQVLGHQLVAGTLNDHPGIIVGVVRDFHLHSLRSHIEPVLMTSQSEDYAFAGIKISNTKSLDEIKQIWQSVYPDNVFEYHFLDDQIGEFYKNETLLNKLIGGFALIAILISCIGLLGLISLLTVQRTKEIGIRKVIGASVQSILILLSKDFIKLVASALILASLFAWMAMNSWLQGFAYHITIPWWIFLLAGVCNLTLALATIGYHAVKAALMNPVKSLKTT